MDAVLLQKFFSRIQHEVLPGKPSQWKMAPEGRGDINSETKPEQAAVVILIFPDKNKEWHILLQKRTKDQREHSGEVSFPGGKKEVSDPDLRNTAIRELNEEMGISISLEQVLCELTPIYIPVSNFKVHVFVTVLLEEPEFRINPYEVSHPILLPIYLITEEKNMTFAPVSIKGKMLEVPCFQYQGHTIWGATAMILSELADLLRTSHL